MFAKALEGVLPGLREFRVPLVTGFLWAVFGWLLLADGVPYRAEAEGLWGDLYRLTEWLGRSGTMAVALSIMYLVGHIVVGASRPVLEFTARATLRPRAWWRFQLTARDRRKTLRLDLLRFQEMLERKLKSVETDQQAVKTLNGQINQSQASLTALTPRGWWPFRFVRRSAETRRLVPAPDSLNAIAEQLVAHAVQQGAYAEQDRLGETERKGLYLSARELDLAPYMAHDLLGECSDPLHLASSIDTDFFLALDRERSERELRMNAALPLIAIFIAIAWSATLWGLIGTVVAATALFTSVREPDFDRLRVMKFISVNGSVTGTLRRAEIAGRDQARAILEQRRQDRDGQAY